MENLPTILFNNEVRTLQFEIMDEENVAPVNLTGWTIVFAIGDANTTPQFTATMTITAPLLGLCEVSMTALEINALTSGRLRYSLRRTVPANSVLQYGFVTVAITF